MAGGDTHWLTMSQMTEGPIFSSMYLPCIRIGLGLSISNVFSESTIVDKGQRVNIAGVRKAWTNSDATEGSFWRSSCSIISQFQFTKIFSDVFIIIISYLSLSSISFFFFIQYLFFFFIQYQKKICLYYRFPDFKGVQKGLFSQKCHFCKIIPVF